MSCISTTLTDLKTSRQALLTALILCSMNLINNADRYIISSVLIDIQTYFDVSKSTAGLLQTVYLVFYMLASPLAGYAGDRINRVRLLLIGIVVWMSSTILGSLCERDQFWLFVTSRCLFGLATGIFGPVCVPILGDRFAHDETKRSRALVLFSMGPALGIALAYIIGLISSQAAPNDWRWSMRFTPLLLILVLVMIWIFYEEPERAVTVINNAPKQRSYSSDIKILIKNRTYLLLVFSWAFGLSSYVGFNWWSPSLIDYSLRVHNDLTSTQVTKFKSAHSVLQPCAGVLGIILPNELSMYMKKRDPNRYVNIDCFIFAAGFMTSSLLLYIYLLVIDYSYYAAVLVFTLTIASFNICWVIQSKIFLDIVSPGLRSTANSLIIFILHLLGDDLSPYWSGLLADWCLSQFRFKNSFSVLLYCTGVSLYPFVILAFLAGSLALFMSITFIKDNLDSKT